MVDVEVGIMPIPRKTAAGRSVGAMPLPDLPGPRTVRILALGIASLSARPNNRTPLGSRSRAVTGRMEE